jgi:hypothetical protein
MRLARLSVTAALLLSAPAPAIAQEQAPAGGAATAAEQAIDTDDAELGAALRDLPAPSPDAPVKALKYPSLSAPNSYDLSDKTAADGSTTYSVKKTLPTDWSTSIGADLGTAAPSEPYYQPDRPIAPARNNTGAAWATVCVSSVASVDARVDPTADLGRVATTLHRSLPLGRDLSLTLQNSSGVTETLGTQPAAPAGLPVMALAQLTGTGATRAWDDQPSVKFNVLSTGTTLSAGLARTSTDPVLHNSLSADQKLYGPLHVSTALNDVGESTENKSITASFKLNW